MSTIKQYISVESFAKYYLVNEYLLNGESCFTSIIIISEMTD